MTVTYGYVKLYDLLYDFVKLYNLIYDYVKSYDLQYVIVGCHIFIHKCQAK